MRRIAQKGTVISGTMRPGDLLRVWTNELEWLSAPERSTKETKLIADCQEITDFDSWDCAAAHLELMKALDSYAPEGCYFGSHPDDGADWGFWDWPDPVPDHWANPPPKGRSP